MKEALVIIFDTSKSMGTLPADTLRQAKLAVELLIKGKVSRVESSHDIDDILTMMMMSLCECKIYLFYFICYSVDPNCPEGRGGCGADGVQAHGQHDER